MPVAAPLSSSAETNCCARTEFQRFALSCTELLQRNLTPVSNGLLKRLYPNMKICVALNLDLHVRR